MPTRRLRQNCAAAPCTAAAQEITVKILIFSDIHGDLRALERIVAQPADLYIAAGDLATFGKGLDRCGEILKPLGTKLWVLPGNHETHDDTRALCQRFGFVDFHRQLRSLHSAGGGELHLAGLGYSNITPFNTPGEYSEEEISARSLRLRRYRSALSRGSFSAGRHQARRIRAWKTRGQSRAPRMGSKGTAAVSFLRAYPRNSRPAPIRSDTPSALTWASKDTR